MVGGRRRLLSVTLALGVVAMLAACTPVGDVVASASAPAVVKSDVASTKHPIDRIGAVVRSVSVPGATTADIAAASDTALYVAVSNDSDDGTSWTIDRIDAATGAVTSRELTLPFLRNLVVGPDGLYVTTSVIERFKAEPDTLLRLDLTSLATLASRRIDTRALFDGNVSVAASNGRLIEADGGGAVRLLDPGSLTTLLTRRIITSRSDLEAADDVEDPVIAGDRVWVYSKQHFLALSLSSLATLSSTSSRGYSSVQRTSEGLVVIGDRFGRLSKVGTIVAAPSVAGVDTIEGTDRVGGTDAGIVEQPNTQPPRLVLRSWTGQVLASQELDADTGLLLATSGRDVWTIGDRAAPKAVTLIHLGEP